MADSNEGGSAGDPPKQQEQRRRRRQGDPKQPGFIPETMDKSIIAIPLLDMLDQEEEELGKDGEEGRAAVADYELRRVIIDLNLEYKGGRDSARQKVEQLLEQLRLRFPNTIHVVRDPQPPQYVFAIMTGPAIRELVALDAAAGPLPDTAVGRPKAEPGTAPRDPVAPERGIYRIWPDFEV